jgi:hypothetical protein
MLKVERQHESEED